MGVETVGLFVASLAFEAGFTISATTGYTIAVAAAVAGSVAASAALMPDVPAARTPRQAKQHQSLEGGPRYRVRGRALLGGALVFVAARDNKLYRVAVYGQGEAVGIEEVYVNDRLVGLDAEGRVATEPYYVDDTTSWGRVKFALGTDTQDVLPLTSAEFAARWPASATARGLVVAEARWESPGAQSSKHPKVYPVGYPVVGLVQLGAAIFDPRVAGASFDDRGTWIWSDNGVLNVLDHLTGARADGGWTHPIAWFDLDDIALEADRADAPVATRTGTEPRSRCWGVQDLGPDKPLVDTLSALLLSTGTTLAVTDRGLITIRLIDDAAAPTVDLAWRDLVSLDLTAPGGAGEARPNKFSVGYYAPERRYEVAQADVSGCRWAQYDDEIAAVGEVASAIDLPYCPSPAQAGRIGRRIAALRRASRIEAAANLGGLAAMGHAEARIEVEPLGETIAAAIQSVRLEGLGAEAPVTLSLIELDALDAWTPALDEPEPPAEVADVADGPNVTAPEIRDGALVSADGGVTWYARFKIAFTDGGIVKQQLMWRSRTGRRYSMWTPIARGSSWSAASSPIYVQVGPVDDGAQAIASSAPSSSDLSDWTDRYEIQGPDPTRAPAKPVIVTEGTPTLTWARSSIDAVAIDVWQTSGWTYVGRFGTDASGAIQAASYTSGYTLVAIDSFGRASSPLVT